MDVASLTSVGMVRKNNEDSCLVIPSWSSLALKKGICVFAVADGMGGENSGEVASKIAVDCVKKWINRFSSELLTLAEIEEMFSYINNEIWEHANKFPETKGMGTTLTIVVMKDNAAIVGHIGDSRLYRIRNDVMEQLTNDHSLVAEQVKNGKISREEARTHSSRHILSRVLGGRQFVVPDVFELKVEKEDLYFMCTDGIYGMISDCEIKKIIDDGTIENMASAVIEAANSAGGKDNSTAIFFKINGLPIDFPGYFSIRRLKSYFKTKDMVGFI